MLGCLAAHVSRGHMHVEQYTETSEGTLLNFK